MPPKSLLPSQKAPQEESRINWVKVAPPKKSLKSLGRMLKISDRLNKAGRIGIHGAVGFSIAAFLVGQPEYLSQRLNASLVLAGLSVLLEVQSTKLRDLIFAKCIGKPRVSRELMKYMKNEQSLQTLYVLGKGRYNITEKEALKALFQRKANQMDKGFANRALKRETERLKIELSELAKKNKK